MSFWRQLTRGLHALVNPRAEDQDIADEVENYLEQATADLEARGVSPSAARRAARLDLGSATAVREQVRSSGWENAIAAPLSDLRYAARRLRGNPGFTTVSVLTLALGIGASTAIFSTIEGVLLKPLPYRQSRQIVALRHTAPGIHIDDLNMAASLYFTYSEENRVFSGRRHVAGGYRDRNGWWPARGDPGSVGDESISRCSWCPAGDRTLVRPFR